MFTILHEHHPNVWNTNKEEYAIYAEINEEISETKEQKEFPDTMQKVQRYSE